MLNIKYVLKGLLSIAKFLFSGFGYWFRFDDSHVVFIHGWYGTETLGDRLIVLGIIRCIEVDSQTKIKISSLDIGYTKDTLKILKDISRCDPVLVNKLNNIEIVGLDDLKAIKKGDKIIFGGGPVMKDPALLLWISICVMCKIKGAKYLVIGAGLGPFYSKFWEYIAGCYLKLADGYVLRPSIKPSTTFLSSLIKESQFVLCPSFITRSLLLSTNIGENIYDVMINLRDIPPNYTSKQQNLVSVNDNSISLILSLLNFLPFLKGKPSLGFFSTHEHDNIGDSEVANKIMRKLKISTECHVNDAKVIEVLSRSEYIVSSRYHGAIIAIMFGRKLIPLDYTQGGGKLSALLSFFDPEYIAINLFEDLDLSILDEYRHFSVSCDTLDYEIQKSYKQYVELIN